MYAPPCGVKVLTHSVVIGELVCGTLPKRRVFLEDIQLLPKATEASFAEVLAFVESMKLWGKGIGWNDAQLIASAILSDARIYTLDKKLRSVAKSLVL